MEKYFILSKPNLDKENNEVHLLLKVKGLNGLGENKIVYCNKFLLNDGLFFNFYKIDFDYNGNIRYYKPEKKWWQQCRFYPSILDGEFLETDQESAELLFMVKYGIQ